ncbi:MAG TPA: FG-GAP-like repeat-containing protein [Verrucomicrobiae bacterium]
MKTIIHILVVGMLLAALSTAFGQCSITITTQPTNQTCCPGTDATFTVGATGTGPLSYQWQKSPDGVNSSDLPGCTNATLAVTNVQVTDRFYYHVIITNSECSVTSHWALLSLFSPAVISSSGQPTNWPPVSLGASVANRVMATGTAPFTYQWRLNGAPIVGQTRSSISLTNLQMADAGTYDVVVSYLCGSVISSNVRLVVDPTFFKWTTGAIVTDQASFGPGSWADYDDDGFVDLFVPAGLAIANQRPALYRNVGGTNFTRVGGVVEMPRPYCHQGLWGDLNNDGCMDLLEIGTKDDSVGLATNRLLLASPEHTFGWVTNAVGINPRLPVWYCALVDYDNDGSLDLFLTTGNPGTGSRSTLWRNRGDATFANVWTAPGPINYNVNGCWVDYDNDGDRDLWLESLEPGEQFYRNNGDGTFDYIVDGMLPSTQSVASAWGDYDNDGYVDCLTGNFLYHNDQGTGFTLVNTNFFQTPATILGFNWADYDNDGDLDCIGCSVGVATVLMRNDGDGFTAVDVGSPTHDTVPPGNFYRPAWSDYDNDGFLDLFVSTGEASSFSNFLYRNSGLAGGNTNHWLIVKPRGIASNSSAIGVKVRVKATIRGHVTWQMRELAGLWLDDLRAHFGLGDATKVDLVRVEWTSGIVQELTNVAPGQILTIVEHQEGGTAAAFAGVATVTDGLQLSILEPGAGTVYALQASTDLVNWTKLMARKSGGGTFAYTDARSANYPRRFYRVVVP